MKNKNFGYLIGSVIGRLIGVLKMKNILTEEEVSYITEELNDEDIIGGSKDGSDIFMV